MSFARALGLSAIVGSLIACTTGAKPTSAPERATAATASGAAAVSTGATTPPPAASTSAAVAKASPDAGAAAGASAPEEAEVGWTDLGVVDALAKDCSYAPRGVVRPKGVDRDFWGDGTALSCEWGLYGQSCVVDPCLDEQKDVCNPKCQKTCEGCAATCVSGCQTCKATCKGDPACVHACAKKCGACRQECLLAKDRCSSGACAKRNLECKREMMAKWIKSGCDKACKAYYVCAEACPDDDPEKCRDGCRSKTLGPCTPAFRSACIFNGLLYSPDELTGP